MARRISPQSILLAGAAVGAFAAIAAYLLIYKQKSKKITQKDDRNHNHCSSCTVSAPGKALIAGGYLVLDAPNIGIVIAATARFYTTIKWITPSTIDSHSRKGILNITVDSVQFHQKSKFSFKVSTENITCIGIVRNNFIERCLQLALLYIKHDLGELTFNNLIDDCGDQELLITLQADNDFYSQTDTLRSMNLPFNSQSLKMLPKFKPCPIDNEGNVIISKTGMGSSAALTTSLVGALLVFFGVVHMNHLSDTVSRRIIHNLSQLAHAIAQGKIGSGFDVASAVYGSIVYTRFDAAGLSSLPPSPSSSLVHAIINTSSVWNQTIQTLSLPYPLNLMMGDVSGGSSSVSMAKAVLNWRVNEQEEAEQIWEVLATHNQLILQAIQKLSLLAESNKKDYLQAIHHVDSTSYESWIEDNEIVCILSEIKRRFHQVRTLLKRMGDCAGVEIEPNSQTELANATDSLPGVVCAGVPGAGGVDALFCIVISERAKESVEALWGGWKDNVVCPLILESDSFEEGSAGERGIRFVARR